jgi:Protein of unknown function (DUF4232)
VRIVAVVAAVLALGGSTPVREIPLGGDAAFALAVAHGSVWAIVGRLPTPALVRVDPATGSATTVRRDADSCCAPVAAASGVWLGAVSAVVNGRHELATGSSCIGPFTIAAGAVWRVDGAGGSVDTTRPGSLCRVNLATGARRTVRVAAPAIDVAASGGRIWVGELDGTLLAFDARTVRLTARLRLGDYGVIGLAGTPAGLWATNGAAMFELDGRTGRVLRRFDGAPDFFSGALGVDGADAYVVDGRLRVRQVGHAGVAPVPDLGAGAEVLAVGAGAVWTAARPAKLVRLPLPLSRVRARAPHGSTGGTCTPRDLHASVLLQGATGSAAGAFGVVNVGKRSCTLVGRPPVRFTAADGEAEPVVVSAWPRRRGAVTLRPHRRAYASVWWSNWCGAANPITIHAGVRGGYVAAATGTWLQHPRCDGPRGPSFAAVSPWQLPTG